MTADRFGNANSAYEFDGEDDYVETTLESSGKTKTLTAWILPKSSGVVSYLESVIDSDVPAQYGTGWGLNNGYIKVIADNLFWSTSQPVILDQWQHVAVTYSPTELKLYYNGELVDNKTYTQGSITVANYKIGKSNANPLYFHGFIDEVRIYNRALSDEEILELYGCDVETLPAINVGTEVSLADQTIEPSGGVISIAKPGDPLDGLEIEVPSDAYGEPTRFEVSYAPITGHDFGDNFNPISPLITVENGAGYSEEIIKVRIPVKVPQGYFAMSFVYDDEAKKLEGMPLLAQDADSITVGTRHFSSFVVSMISKAALNKDIDSGFKPHVDDWQFTNNGSYIAPGGHCAGQSVTALWYYCTQPDGKGATLYGRYDNNGNKPATPNLWEDDSLGYRFASTVHADINWSSFENKFWTDLAGVNDEATWNLFAYSMQLTGEPQEVGIFSGFRTDKKSFLIEVESKSQVPLDMKIIKDGVKLEHDAEGKYPLTAGLNRLGIIIRGEVNKTWEYVDFKYVDILMSNLVIEPASIDGEPNKDYTFTAKVDNPPEKARYDWFVDDKKVQSGDSNTFKFRSKDEGTFDIQAKLFDKDGKELTSGAATINIQKTVPTPPSTENILYLEYVENTIVDMFWLENTIADMSWQLSTSIGYYVEFQRFELKRDGVVIATITDPNTTSYRDEGLEKGKTYSYQLVLYWHVIGQPDQPERSYETPPLNVTTGKVDGSIKRDTTWRDDTYELDSVCVDGAVLTIESGATVIGGNWSTLRKLSGWGKGKLNANSALFQDLRLEFYNDTEAIINGCTLQGLSVQCFAREGIIKGCTINATSILLLSTGIGQISNNEMRGSSIDVYWWGNGQISNNEMRDSSIMVYGGSTTISGNSILSSITLGSIFLGDSEGLTTTAAVEGNNIVCHGCSPIAIYYCDDASTATITGNTLFSSESENDDTYDDIIVSGDDITDEYIIVSSGDDICVSGPSAATIEVHQNNICGKWGVWVEPDCNMKVIATDNYWGHSSGPRAVDNPDGLGANVSGNVTYRPWLPTGKCTPDLSVSRNVLNL